jgi:5-(carboxyamino)imidazole ribonucleotide mutase
MNRRVAIVMGSDTDWPTVEAAYQALDEMGIEAEVHVLSAHRSPEALREFVQGAEDRGIAVIIAAAGGAAHLPGVIAADTPLPVIGIPIETSTMGGLDSLLSISQMPGGVPVATMAIGVAGARNAGLFAARILALDDESVRERVAQYREKLAEQMAEKNRRLQARLSDEAAAPKK